MSSSAVNHLSENSGIFDINQGWTVTLTPPGVISEPQELPRHDLNWIDAPVPGTIAQACAAEGSWDFSSTDDFDASDVWYRCGFPYMRGEAVGRIVIRLSGLATLADVWLNGQHILQSNNMYLCHDIDVDSLIKDENELVICFHSLNAALKVRRPRPRWKTRIVRNQQLRWFRTTLLGRMLGLSPAIAPVGPWRPISMLVQPPHALQETSLQAETDGAGEGLLTFTGYVGTQPVDSVSGELSVAGTKTALQVKIGSDGHQLVCTTRIPEVQLWWPHTHGEARLYPCQLDLKINDQLISYDLGRVGFRRIQLDQNNGEFTLKVNDREIFCRGACWTVNNIVSLGSTKSELEHSLQLLKQAGGNMVKVGATMTYESDDFYHLCDELGILVWQEFMFANMDYPFGDEEFLASVKCEVRQQLMKWRSHPCIAVYCGGSDIELEASMFGLPRDQWRNQFFAEILPEMIADEHTGVPYVPSSPSGGTMPFHVGAGVTHYYAIGAFMQPLSRVRGDGVRFAAECMGFAHIPEPDVIDSLFGGEKPMLHDPRWKQRVARHSGYGYDFDDVRDYYLEQLFNFDSRELRFHDTERYLALSRITPGEVLTRVYSEWRRPGSPCDGGMMWFLKDFWPGAGQGLLDSQGRPKASYYAASRVWQPCTVMLTDEGFDGVAAHVINDGPEDFSGVLEMVLLREGRTVVAKGQCECFLAAGKSFTTGSDEILNGFFDAAYVYRFGPPNHDVVIGTLYDKQQGVHAQAFYFPLAKAPTQVEKVEIKAIATAQKEGYQLTIEANRLLYAVRIDVAGFVPEDNYFHLAPGVSRTIMCQPISDDIKKYNGYIEAVNLSEPTRILVTAD